MMDKAKDIKTRLNEGTQQELSGVTFEDLETGAELVNSVPSRPEGGMDGLRFEAETNCWSTTKNHMLTEENQKTEKLKLKAGPLSMEDWLAQLKIMEDVMEDVLENKNLVKTGRRQTTEMWPLVDGLPA
ncbi:unnamed protein product [Urochloa humidicola]